MRICHALRSHPVAREPVTQPCLFRDPLIQHSTPLDAGSRICHLCRNWRLLWLFGAAACHDHLIDKMGRPENSRRQSLGGHGAGLPLRDHQAVISGRLVASRSSCESRLPASGGSPSTGWKRLFPLVDLQPSDDDPARADGAMGTRLATCRLLTSRSTCPPNERRSALLGT